MKGLRKGARGDYLIAIIREQESTFSRVIYDERVMIESYHIEEAIAEHDLSSGLLQTPIALSGAVTCRYNVDGITMRLHSLVI